MDPARTHRFGLAPYTTEERAANRRRLDFLRTAIAVEAMESPADREVRISRLKLAEAQRQTADTLQMVAEHPSDIYEYVPPGEKGGAGYVVAHGTPTKLTRTAWLRREVGAFCLWIEEDGFRGALSAFWNLRVAPAIAKSHWFPLHQVK